MKNVLLIDSGSGGVNVLKSCLKETNCNYLLFCDDKNLPYGNKSISQLQSITLKNLYDIKIFFDFDIVVFACNTISCTCLDRAREEFPNVVFIGTVPAIKPALEKFKPEDILVIATEVTIKNNILINKNNVVTKALPKLAELIDKNLDNLWNKDILSYLQVELAGFHPKALVLGCTHYFAIKEQFKSVLGAVEIYDSAKGVAKRLHSFISPDENDCLQIQIMTSGKSDMLSQFWWHYTNN